jgi:hypothetical protein
MAMARKSTWITAGLLSAAAAGAAVVLAKRHRREHPAEENSRALADFEPHPQNAGRHKKERIPRKLKKHLHAEAGTGHGGQHW